MTFFLLEKNQKEIKIGEFDKHNNNIIRAQSLSDTSADLKVTLVVMVKMMIIHLLLLLLLLLLPDHLLLPPELHDLAVRVRVLGQHEGRARRGSVLGHEPTRLVPHAARVAQRLRPLWARPPLRRLLRRAVRAPPHHSIFGAGAPAL